MTRRILSSWSNFRLKFWIEYGKAIYYFANRLLDVFLYRNSSRIVLNIVHSIQESYHLLGLKTNVASFKVLTEAHLEDYDQAFIDKAIRNDIGYIRKKEFPSRNYYELKEVTFSVSKGLIWNDKGHIFSESFSGSVKRLLYNTNPHIMLSLNAKFVEGDNLISLPVKPFYHFVFEELPAILFALENCSYLKIVIDQKSQIPAFYMESLKYLLGDKFEDKVILCSGVIKTSDYTLISKPDTSGYISNSEIEILNQYFDLEDTESTDGHKIYISREMAPSRNMENEAKFQKSLERLGFKVLHLEKLSFVDQVRAVKQASEVIAPHGAGLSNLVWGKKEKKVIEIFPSQYQNLCFARLAALKGHSYRSYACNRQDGKEMIPIDDIIQSL
ncbi:glycosyltransferase family 61 protein [Reichenbachiella versicolor]|uniref:glycosyltransferase family 61 protein n=1 Tax=Reichenbachiella versicolor TaxID=1821036 RepID=UPI000D6E5833|nr:glycosyltransferase family 61 protein [Reichenbachiella versicolor]